MLRTLLKSKLHHARVTAAELLYMGSVTIDRDLMDATDILPNEKVLVVNLENGKRMETYAFSGERGSGAIVMNGGLARHCEVGDRVLICAFGLFSDEDARRHRPKVAFLDEKNAITHMLESA